MDIFKAYDVRGKYPEEVNEELAYNIGRAMVILLKAKNFLVCRDARKGSEDLARAFMKGVTDQGSNVTYSGLATTPMFYYFKYKKGFDAGVMITASHLPSGYNGLKAMKKDGFMGYDSGYKEIQELIDSGELKKIPLTETKGNVTNTNYEDEYVNFIINSAIGEFKGLKIVVDASNAMAGPILKKVLDKVGVDYIGLNMGYNLENPAHSLNPLKTDAHTQVREKIKSEGAVLGAVFDADADRIVFMDETGDVLPGDYALAILVQHLAKPGDKIVHDLLCGRAFKEAVRAIGCEPVETRVGHVFIKHKMVELNARLGAEISCHMYFQEAGGAESTILCLLDMIGIVNKKGKLSKLIAPLKQAWIKSVELNYELSSNNLKDKKIEEIKQTFSDGEQSLLDGVKVEYDDAWFNVRKSNTEPVLRLRIEAKTKRKLAELQAKIESIILSKDTKIS
ncbi:MAG: phosphomannomutase/phosphoglucomutase [archaeon]